MSDDLIKRLRDSQERFIFQGGSQFAAELAGRRYGWAINFARAIEQAHGIVDRQEDAA